MASKRSAMIAFALKGIEAHKVAGRKWTPEEEDFLRTNLGYMTEEEIAKKLNRTVTAIHLRWERDMQLPAPSKTPGLLTAQKAAEMLGIDQHKIAHWVDRKFIPGRVMAGGRRIRLIEEQAFLAWCLDTNHWLYFDPANVADAELKAKLKARAREWHDEWWTTLQVAAYHGVVAKDVLRYIKLGRIQATQIEYSLGGRHPQLRWANWFVLKSEATRKGLKFFTWKTLEEKQKAVREQRRRYHQRSKGA